MPSPSMTDKLTNYFRASFPGLALETHEEARALREVTAAAKATEKELAIWSASAGLRYLAKGGKPVNDTEDLLGALKLMRIPNTVYIILDSHTWPWDRDPVLGRALRDALVWGPTEASIFVFIGARATFHATSEKLITILPYSLPGEGEFKRLAESLIDPAEVKKQLTDEVLSALAGLGIAEAENALALALVETGKFDAGVIAREKVSAVRRSGLLDILQPHPLGFDAVGGFEIAKEWTMRRRAHFSRRALAYGLPRPKAVLLGGVQGTGKSLFASCVATAFNVPYLSLDMSKLFGSLVGESESRARECFATLKALAPCVCRIDEIDKGLSGTSARGADADSGVSRRILGIVLTEMQENDRGVFFVATANEVSALDPAIFRKGRFDEIFSIDLPHTGERTSIVNVKIRERGRKPAAYDTAAIVRATDGFTGAEIEAAINEGMSLAFDAEEREFTSADIVAGAEEIIPISRSAREKVDEIRDWAKKNARSASRVDETAPTARIVNKRMPQSLN